MQEVENARLELEQERYKSRQSAKNTSGLESTMQELREELQQASIERERAADEAASQAAALRGAAEEGAVALKEERGRTNELQELLEVTFQEMEKYKVRALAFCRSVCVLIAAPHQLPLHANSSRALTCAALLRVPLSACPDAHCHDATTPYCAPLTPLVLCHCR
jgi:hypothetical protein